MRNVSGFGPVLPSESWVREHIQSFDLSPLMRRATGEVTRFRDRPCHCLLRDN